MGLEFLFQLYVYYGYGVYICGEEMVLFELFEGKKGQLCFKLLFLVSFGVYGKLIMINNIEMFVVVLFLLFIGLQNYFEIGKLNNGGMKIFLVLGDVECLGNYEVLFGMLFVVLMEFVGGMCGGKKIKVVILGGLLVLVILGDIMMQIDFDYDLIVKVGLMFGFGVVIVMDEMCCMVCLLLCLLYFYCEELCGQCMLCCEGIGWLYCVVNCIEYGEGCQEDLDLLNLVVENIMGCMICVFGDVVVMLVCGMLKYYWDEFVYYVEYKYCMVGGYVYVVVV